MIKVDFVLFGIASAFNGWVVDLVENKMVCDERDASVMFGENIQTSCKTRLPNSSRSTDEHIEGMFACTNCRRTRMPPIPWRYPQGILHVHPRLGVVVGIVVLYSITSENQKSGGAFTRRNVREIAVDSFARNKH